MYVRLLAAPAGLSLFHHVPLADGPADPRVLAGGVAALAGVAAAVWLARRRRRAVLGVAWTALGLAPPLLLLPPSGTPVAERYLYVPAVGLAILLGAGIGAVRAASPGRRPAGARVPLFWAAAAAAVLTLFALLTTARSAVWRDEEQLYRRTLRSEPAAYPLAVNLGLLLRTTGREEEALELFERSLDTARTERRPRPSPQRDLTLARMAFEAGTLRLRRGEPGPAEGHWRAALRQDPTHEGAALSLSALLASTGRLAEAEAVLVQAIRHHPASEALARNLESCRRLLAKER